MKPKSPTDLPCACAAARQLARVLTHLYDGKLRNAGIEAPQFALLMTLSKQAGSNQVDLGRRYALDKTTVSRNLKLLERNGWIRSSIGTDRRERQFTLTATGKKKLEAAKVEWKKAQNRLRETMTPTQWNEMFRVLKHVTQAAQTETQKLKTDD